MLAGGDAAEAPIRWVHISELVDPTPLLSGGSSCSPPDPARHEERRAYVPAAREPSPGRPRVRHRVRPRQIPPALLERPSARLPGFRGPLRDAVHRDHREGVHPAGQRAVRAAATRIAIHRRLEQLVLEERGLDEVTRALSAAIGGTVAGVDGARRGSPQAIPRALSRTRARPRSAREVSGRRERQPADAFAPDTPTCRAGARAAGRTRGRRPAGVARGGRATGAAWRVRAPDLAAGGNGGGARVDAPAGHARHRAQARRRRPRGGRHGRARRPTSSRPGCALRRGRQAAVLVFGSTTRRPPRRRSSGSLRPASGARRDAVRGCSARSSTAMSMDPLALAASARDALAGEHGEVRAAASRPAPRDAAAQLPRGALRARGGGARQRRHARGRLLRTSAPSSCCSRCRTTTRCGSSATACSARSRTARATTAAS